MFRLTEKAATENIRDEFFNVCDIWQVPVKYHVQRNEFYLPTESVFRIRHIANINDVRIHQGQQYALIWGEELTQWDEEMWLLLGGSRRKRGKLGRTLRIGTGNPGDKGEKWFIKRFVNSKDRGVRWIGQNLFDSLPTLERNPGYYDEELRHLPDYKQQQWVFGKWGIISGSYFDVGIPGLIREVNVPPWARWYAASDWGYWPDAFATLWAAKWRDNLGDHLHFKMELKKWKALPDAQAQAACEMEKGAFTIGTIQRPVSRRFGAWDAWKKIQSPNQPNFDAIYKIWRSNGWVTQKCKRTMRVPGWQQMKMLMEHGIMTIDPACGFLIDEMRFAVQEGAPLEIKGEDIDESCEQDCLDGARMMVTSLFDESYKPDTKPVYQQFNEQAMYSFDAMKRPERPKYVHREIRK